MYALASPKSHWSAFFNDFPPRVLHQWCVISNQAAVLTWKVKRQDSADKFYVYFTESRTISREILRQYTEKMVVVEEKVKVGNTASKSSQQDSSVTSAGVWLNPISWFSRGTRDKHIQDESEAVDSGQTGDEGQWFVVEPTDVSQGADDVEQHEDVHTSLSRSIAMTNALRQRSMLGLRKKNSLSDQYLYTPVFRTKSASETQDLFGKHRVQSVQQETLPQKEAGLAFDQEENTRKRQKQNRNPVNNAVKYELKQRPFRYTAVDLKQIKLSAFMK